MNSPSIEEELSELKKRMDALEAKVGPVPRGGWRALIGSQKDDHLFREAMRLGAEWRAKANAEGR